MSSEIYGFADFPHSFDVSSVLIRVSGVTSLGVHAADKSDLVGFPEDLLPGLNSVVFIIGDSKSSLNAQYLLESQDFDPEARIGLPLKARERLALVMNVISGLFDEYGCVRLAVCLTDCNQVDAVKYIMYPDGLETIVSDCMNESPPCILYVLLACSPNSDLGGMKVLLPGAH